MSSLVEISRLSLDGGTQPRAELAKEVIEEYAQAMKDGASFPPAVAFHDGAHFWLADGFHRVKAAAQAGRERILVEVFEGTQADAQWHSLAANQTHGLRRTNADKERAVRGALVHPKAAGLSNNQIAQHCGVSESTVRCHRDHLESTSQIAKSKTRTGRDGRTINTSKIGRRAAKPTRRIVTKAEYEAEAQAEESARSQGQLFASEAATVNRNTETGEANGQPTDPGSYARKRSKNEARKASKLINLIESLSIRGGERGWSRESCEEISEAVARLAQRWESEKNRCLSRPGLTADTTPAEAEV